MTDPVLVLALLICHTKRFVISLQVIVEDIYASWEYAKNSLKDDKFHHILYIKYFFFKSISEALFKVHYNSKIAGLMAWHGVVICCPIAVRQKVA